MSEDKDDILKVDLSHLEVDAAEHSRLVRIWGDRLSEAERTAKDAKNKLRLVKAELSRTIRAVPGKYGITKITEDSVEDVVVMSVLYKNQLAILIEAEYDRDIIKNMVIALHERGEMIGGAIKLHGQMYWSKPNTNEEYSRLDAMREMAEAAEETPKKKKKGATD